MKLITMNAGWMTMLLALAAGGCKSDGDVSYGAISGDLTPELRGTTERPIDVDRNVAVNNNVNLRLLSDDLGRTFYTNHPSSLSPLPITSSSGQPH